MSEVLFFTDIFDWGFGRSAGSYRLVSELRSSGVSTQAIDMYTSMSTEQIDSILSSFLSDKTKLICFSTTFLWPDDSVIGSLETSFGNISSKKRTINNLEYIINKVRQDLPSVKVAFGGYNCLDDSLPLADFYVTGFADRSILALYNHIKNDSPLSIKVNNSGLKIIHSNQYYFVKDISDLKILWDHSDHLLADE